MKNRELLIGSRGSALALAQTEIAASALRRADPSITIRVEQISTTGDVRSDVPLSKMGRGVFVTEIEKSLRAGNIDIAVHSAKDLPSTLDPEFVIGAFLPREDARDVLVAPGYTLATLPAESRIGTSSPRRACLLRSLRPDLRIDNIRGNVDTRLRKRAEGQFDALVLAGAGLVRLGLDSEVTEWLDADRMIPCVGQGALAIEARVDDEEILALLRAIDHLETRTAVSAERAFLAELGAGCQSAAAAHARLDHGQLRITAIIGSVNGEHVRGDATGKSSDAVALGSRIARRLLAEGGARFLEEANNALQRKRIAITRPVEQSGELARLLRENGAEPILCPTIAIQPVGEIGKPDLSALAAATWAVFTSINSVNSVADLLAANRVDLPASLRLAVVGQATARALAARIRAADFVSARANAESLAATLPIEDNAKVIFFRGDLASDDIANGLRSRGAEVSEITVYRTVPGDGVTTLGAALRKNELDAVVFASPSSIQLSGDSIKLLRLRASERPLIICIGETTAGAARDLGIVPDSVAQMQSAEAVVECLKRAFAGNRI